MRGLGANSTSLARILPVYVNVVDLPANVRPNFLDFGAVRLKRLHLQVLLNRRDRRFCVSAA